MCGIAGIISLDGTPLEPETEGRLSAMSAALRHRGPDDEGIYISPDRHCGLAHRRLAIIDPTPEAHQPMVNPYGDALAFNGEIYNYKELRERHKLNVPPSDTAVLLSLLSRNGENVLPELRGFYTFAYYDERQKQLLIARDPIGKKPLYYSLRGQRLIFASEQRALVASGLLRFGISHEILAKYLSLYSVPHPNSILHGVDALGPGNMMRVQPTGSTVISRWYRLPEHQPSTIAYPEAVSETRRLLEQSVKYRLVSDVPVGAFLSGGLDSNAIVGLMSREVGEPIETFSIGFDSRGIESETKWARIGAETFRTRHHERIVTDKDTAGMLPEFFRSMDSPTGDGLNSFLVAKFAREANPNLKVVLSGVGGDELFLGYRKYRWLAKNANVLKVLWALPRSTRERLSHTLSSIIAARYGVATETALNPQNIRVLFLPEEVTALTGLAPGRYRGSSVEDDPILRLLRSDIEDYLPDMLLRDLDVMTMSQSLEARAPLLDTELLEFAWQLPLSLKTRGASKQLLADAVSDILPNALKQKPKTGFELPMREWLLTGALRPYLDMLVGDEMKLVDVGLLDRKALRKVHDDFVQGRSHYMKPWSIIALECWYREHA